MGTLFQEEMAVSTCISHVLTVACIVLVLTDAAATRDLGDQVAAGTATRSIDDVTSDFLDYHCSGKSVKDYMYYMCGTKECGENGDPEKITDICVRIREDGKTACMNANSALWTDLQNGQTRSHTFEFGAFAYWNPTKGSPVRTSRPFLDKGTEAAQRSIWLSGVPLVADKTLKAASARCLVTMTKAQKVPLKYRKRKTDKPARTYRANLSYIKATTCADIIWIRRDKSIEKKATVCGEKKSISMSDYTLTYHKDKEVTSPEVRTVPVKDKEVKKYVGQNFKVFAAQLV